MPNVVLVRQLIGRLTGFRIALVSQFTVTMNGMVAAPLQFIADRSLAGARKAFNQIISNAHSLEDTHDLSRDVSCRPGANSRSCSARVSGSAGGRWRIPTIARTWPASGANSRPPASPDDKLILFDQYRAEVRSFSELLGAGSEEDRRRLVALHGRGRVFYLHQAVVGATHGDGFVVEHVNGRKRDSRRENLRVRSVPAPTMRRD